MISVLLYIVRMGQKLLYNLQLFFGKEAFRVWLKSVSLSSKQHQGCTDHTADGRNPAPVDMGNLPFLTEFHTSQVVVWDFLPSTGGL